MEANEEENKRVKNYFSDKNYSNLIQTASSESPIKKRISKIGLGSIKPIKMDSIEQVGPFSKAAETQRIENRFGYKSGIQRPS